LPDRTNAQEYKRRLLLDAAVRVFARKGYHAARVGDIAEEAGVAYGLLYHYFSSKEEVLRSVFRETWRALIATIESVEEGDDPPREQLRKVTEILLRSWRRDPDLVRVLVLEVTRSQLLAGEMDEIVASFKAIQKIIEGGQADGSIRPDLDARLASYVFYGAIDELLTGWVLGRLPDSDEDLAGAERTVVEIVAGGLAPERAGTLA
jgi:AcrR family transcriptional regulator